MPLPDWFWAEPAPAAPVAPTKPFSFADMAEDGLPLRRGPPPDWVRLKQGDSVRLSFFTDTNTGNALLFQRQEQGVRNNKPYTRHYVVAAVSPPDLAPVTRRSDFKVGFVGMSTKAIMDLRALLQDFRPAAHDLLMTRKQGTFASVKFTPCKNALNGVVCGFQDDLDDLANRLMGGEKF
jgi:hypothetical protein